MTSASKGELWLERVPTEILDKICLHLSAPDFYNVAFRCTQKIHDKMITGARQTLIHRALKLFSPAGIRVAIVLVRLANFYDPERPEDDASGRSILDFLDQGGGSVVQALRKLPQTELWNLIWLQHVVDMFTTNVMNVVVEDSASASTEIGKNMIHRLIREQKAEKLFTEPLFKPTDDWVGFVRGISATEVARAERGFLHSELLLLTSLADPREELAFVQRLQK